MLLLGRIDYPGALHHVIGRGIERRDIFRDDECRARVPACHWLVEKLGMKTTEAARLLKIAQPTASVNARRGERMAARGRLAIGQKKNVII